MRKVILLVLLITFTVSLQATTEKGSYGLIFNLENLLASIDSHSDGFQAGMGVKYWLIEKFALRGLFTLSSTKGVNAQYALTDSGFSITGEYHPIKGEVSPYFGGLAGIKIHSEEGENFSDFYFGGILGGELVWKKYLSVYAEYSLTYAVDISGSTLELGAGNLGQIGLILYFK